MDQEDEYYTQEEVAVPLREPLNLSELRNPLSEGQSFQLREDFMAADENLTSNAYFEPNDVLRNCYVPDEDDNDTDEEDGTCPFEKMAKKMVKLIEDGGVVKKILTHGAGNVIPEGSIVTIHYNGFLEYSDEPFDSSRLRSAPVKRQLGKGQLVEGLEIGISTMKKGELSRFIITHDYAFGKLGCAPRIPPEATVMYEVELMSYVEHAGLDEYNFLTEEEKRNLKFDQLRKVYIEERQHGKQLFDAAQYKKAFRHYRKAATVLEEYHLKDDEEEREQQQMLLKMYHHMAVCSSKLANPGRCINYCKKMMEINPKDVHAFYFYGKSLHQQQEFDRARDYLVKAQRLEPNNSSINEELVKLESNMKKHKVMEADMYSRMFSKPKGRTPKEKEQESNKIKEKENKAYDCSPDWANLVKTKLTEFCNDSSQSEMPFPSYNFTLGEIECILETAIEFGLDAKEVGSGQSYRIKLYKKS
ncbi:inactive peptidyl-prolyl cis-trans isomerase FKBP6-like [Ylistrum balloti]|uniref:inactive peptidyl-prolyl cis-trans isomerase FKBP6-like n=1 Tax=Ylistrum balloti TaxID=509963 RepID=UPI002905D707|nr:inactive peptidyl-prolyl cis-trans isomerase FKBP6-like [Ylistrum balloti]